MLDADPQRWIRLDEVESTNSYLMHSDVPSGCVCLARRQTAGRGRRANDWVSHPDRSFVFSACLVLPTEHALVRRLALLPLAVGMAVLTAARRKLMELRPDLASQSEFQLKWPNDVYLIRNADVGKLAGILIESESSAAQIRIVIGIGLNWKGDITVAQPAGHIPPVSLFERIDRPPEDLTAVLIEEINRRLLQLWSDEVPAVLNEVRRHFYLTGRVIQSGGMVYIVRGIAADGALLVEDMDGRTAAVHDTGNEMNILKGDQSRLTED